MTLTDCIRHHLYYGNRPRRGLRRLARFARAVAGPNNYPKGKVVDAFWFDEFQNFGDALTPWLLSRAGFLPRLASAPRAQVIGVGSLLELVPPNYGGAVWGTGLLYGQEHRLPNATWLAVRGVLTRQLVGAPRGIALGDPGLLASVFHPPGPKRWSLGIVAHHAHRDLAAWKFLQYSVPGSILIDPVGSPVDIFRLISGCDVIVTSSLHGLITADSYGVPAVWVELTDSPLRGGDFKFRDYESALGIDLDRRLSGDPMSVLRAGGRERAAAPDAGIVADLQLSLLDALERMPYTSMAPFRSF